MRGKELFVVGGILGALLSAPISAVIGALVFGWDFLRSVYLAYRFLFSGLVFVLSWKLLAVCIPVALLVIYAYLPRLPRWASLLLTTAVVMLPIAAAELLLLMI